MIFNFEIPQESTKAPAKPSIKQLLTKTKGNWKQKRRAVKSTLNPKKHMPITNPTTRPITNPVSKPITPPEFTTDAQNPNNVPVTAQHVVKPRLPYKKQQKVYTENDSFVSSLFTANPPVVLPPSKNSKILFNQEETPPAKQPINQPEIIINQEKKAEPVKQEKIPEKSVFSSYAESFHQTTLNPLLITHLSTKLSITQPTKIQKSALPILLTNQSRDILIKAQTGSGKTLAFLLPIINQILKASEYLEMPQKAEILDRKIGCLAIVLAPTRELARQIYGNLESFLSFSNAGIVSRDRVDPTGTTEVEEVKEESKEKQFKNHWIVPGLVVGGGKIKNLTFLNLMKLIKKRKNPKKPESEKESTS